MSYYNSLSSAVHAAVKGQPVYMRTEGFMEGFIPPYKVQFLNAEGGVVKTISAFVMWDWEVPDYLDLVPSGYALDKSMYKHCYAVEYMSMDIAVSNGQDPKFLGAWDDSMLEKPRVRKDEEGYYLEKDQPIYEILFTDQPIVDLRVISN